MSDEEKELQLVHLPEGLPVEILPLKEEKDDLLFSAKHFSPMVLAATPTAGLSADAHDFKAFWMEAPATSHDTGRWYTDGSNGDMRKQKKLNLVPQEYTSNAVITSTIGVELTLKGNKNTKYKPGTVIMDIPARIYKGWDSSDPNKIAVSSLKTINIRFFRRFQPEYRRRRGQTRRVVLTIRLYRKTSAEEKRRSISV